MYRLITGCPGSGKSYYAMCYLMKFIKFDKLYKTLLLDHDVLLVTNIDDIKVTHISVQDWQDNGMFNIEKTREYLRDRGYKRIVVVVDEAQKFFSGLKDNDVFFWFEYHRHLGIDIFLICHDVVDLPKRLVGLAEYVVEALPRSQTIMGFRYNLLDSKTGRKLDSSYLRVNQDVFRVYKSFEVDEKEKPKKILFRKIAMYASLLLVVCFVFIFGVKGGYILAPPKNNKVAQSVTKQAVKNETSEPVQKAAEPETVKPDFVFVPGERSNMKSGKQVKGIATTNSGSYFFY